MNSTNKIQYEDFEFDLNKATYCPKRFSQMLPSGGHCRS